MANKFRGEADLEFTRIDDGEEKPAKFRLAFDANALCELEEEFDTNLEGLVAIFSDQSKLSMRKLRGIIRIGLERHHRDAELTDADAGDIISDAGLELTMEALTKAFGGAFGEKEKAGNGKRTGRQKP